jgi:hypothetical protein
VTVLLAGLRPRHHRLLTHLNGAQPSLDLIHPDPTSALVHARSLIGPSDRPTP